MAYSGWELSEKSRAELLRVFPPVYPDVIAHHITLNPFVKPDSDPPEDVEASVIGFVDDGVGVQALIVQINGNCNRDRGGVYHITWSIDRAAGFKPVDSNKAIATVGYHSCPDIPIQVTPKVFK